LVVQYAFMKVQPLTLRNALVWNGKEAVRRDLYVSDVVLDKPHPNAITIDLSGCTIFPALINAHDHLELNHYPRSKFRERYDNAHQWGEDMNARLDQSPYRELRAYPLEDRLFIGGLKNLLCGALTVAHHNPPHKPLFRKDFPVRVLRRYGWAHSLHFSSDEEIVRSYRSTPPDVPWFIHLAEGTDNVAAGEYRWLRALGCVGKNTVIVHGVGLTEEDIADAAPKVRGLVWCPTTNEYLLGSTIHARNWIERGGQLAIGSDSRLTAEDDLSYEIVTAHQKYDCAGETFYWETRQLNAVTDWAATIIGAFDAGNLRVGSQADFFVRMETASFLRSLNVLIVRGGVPQIGNPEIMAKFPHIETVEATLDGFPKFVNVQLARQIKRCSLKERGLELLGKPKARMFTLI
jgi:cytosine/adenosine deaminase-related metal-dependent hydrolase